MITLRPSQERGRSQLDWLDSRHTFSFSDYYDPLHMHFGALRVINEDWVAPGQGFGRHPHRDMEIITYMLEGALEHRDSMGTGSVIRMGEIQRMSAGTGVYHSEYNASSSEAAHLLQIWILPERKGIEPSYEQTAIAPTDLEGKLHLAASPDGGGKPGTVLIHQDARVYASRLKAGTGLTHSLEPGRQAWIQVARGGLTVNGERLEAGDGAAARQERSLEISGEVGAAVEFLLFDLAEIN